MPAFQYLGAAQTVKKENMYSSNKNRSRRLRKKLHLAEFTELGFQFEVDLKGDLSQQDEEALADRFLSEIVEPSGLLLGGWVTSGYIAKFHHSSATEEDREAIRQWLAQQTIVDAVRVGELIDAWNAPDYSQPLQ